MLLGLLLAMLATPTRPHQREIPIMKPKHAWVVLTVVLAALVCPPLQAGKITYTGSGTGPFTGAYKGGVVLATVAGSSVVPGGATPEPNSGQFPFTSGQVISITDSGDQGASVQFAFTGATLDAGDYLFVTNVAGESSIVVSALQSGVAVDANWAVLEAVGDPVTFADDGSGVSATLTGVADMPGGVLLQSGVSGIDEVFISWTGNGSNNQGLQMGLIAIPEPTTLSVGVLLLAASVSHRRRLGLR